MMRLLTVQFIFALLVSSLLYLYKPDWFMPSFCGSLVILLPNVVFVLFIEYSSSALIKMPTVESWLIIFGWIVKFVVTILLLAIAIAIFKTEFIALGIGFLLSLKVNYLAPFLGSLFFKK